VVEDEAFIAEMLAEILAAEGYEVDVACNGRVALEKIGAQDYDLIFSDLRMPELDGGASTGSWSGSISISCDA